MDSTGYIFHRCFRPERINYGHFPSVSCQPDALMDSLDYPCPGTESRLHCPCGACRFNNLEATCAEFGAQVVTLSKKSVNTRVELR